MASSSQPPITVILNPRSGQGSAAEGARDLERHFADAGRVAHVISPDSQELSAVLDKVAREPNGIVVAGGGDGTISTVAGALVGTNSTLGVLPLGTLNHFAKDLGIPQRLEDAVRVIVSGRVIEVDVGQVNDRVFINNSSLGLYPRIVSSRDEQQERLGRGKWPAFAWAFVQAFHRYPYLHLRITIDGRTIERRTAFLFVGNNDYTLHGFNLGGRVALDKGHLGMYVTRRTGRWGLLRLFFHALLGRLNQAKDFDAFSVVDAIVEARHARLLVATDGEVNPMRPPLHYRIRPRALRVLVPQIEQPPA